MQTVGKLSFLEYGQKTGYFVHENFVDKRVQQTATAKKKKKKKNFPTPDRRLDTSTIPNYHIYLVYKFSLFFPHVASPTPQYISCKLWSL